MKKLLLIVLGILVAGGLVFCSDDSEGDMIGEIGDSDQTWAIYWYLCGSDLESEYGAATEDLEEMMETTLPDNVKVIIETGGAYEWQNDYVDPGVNQRWVYSGDELELVDEKPMTNMGKASSLTDFLKFCKKNYPADKTMAIFWNHGGGSVSGAAFDENYEYDSLTLSEFRKGFKGAYSLSEEEPPVDVVGFDACLMGSIDTADAFSGVANYLVASPELEPGGGWAYNDFLWQLADEPGMDGARLGQIICDTYYDSCGWLSEDEATLSVVDITKLQPLKDAYEDMGDEALLSAVDDPKFLSELGRIAGSTENYGGNTEDMGYSNLVDLGHLASNCGDILPDTSGSIDDALKDCVLYAVNGEYHADGTGISCYYSYNNDPDDLAGYKKQGCSRSFSYLFEYSVKGDLSSAGVDYVAGIGEEEPEEVEVAEVPEITEFEDDFPIDIDEDGYAYVELGREKADMLKGVYFQLAYMDEDDDFMILLGQDNDIVADWDTGKFTDNFRNVWGAIDGHLVYMSVSYEGEDYTGYYVPILLNGEEYYLRVVYDFNDEEFHILGARQGFDDSGMAEKDLRPLEPGDEITTIHYVSTISGDDDFEPMEGDTFEVTEDTSFAEEDIGDGEFMMMFELVDSSSNSVFSDALLLTVNGDETDIEKMD